MEANIGATWRIRLNRPCAAAITVTSCYGGCRQYQWVDERGRRAKCSAAQYMDHVLSTTQSLISDETIFPTKYGL